MGELRKARLRVEQSTGQVRAWYPCPNHPSGEVLFVMTRQLVRGTDEELPTKTCRMCGRRRPALAFLAGAEAGPVYSVVRDKGTCMDCQPPEPIRIRTDECGHLRMLVDLRDETGVRVRFHDDAMDRRWQSIENLGLRRMGRDSNELRWQPYTDRSGAVRSTKAVRGAAALTGRLCL